MNYTIEDIISVLGCGSICIDGSHEISHIVFDTRKIIQPGNSMFIALKGNQHDGHQYLRPAWEMGIRNFLIEKGHEHIDLPESNILMVADTLESLQKIAVYHRKRFNLNVIGITGSNGKTIVKEWLFQMLHEKYHIVRSPKSYNSQLGVPLSVLGISENDELGIFEAGISEPGEMKNLTGVIAPDIGIFTNIGEAHNANFDSLQHKILEKLLLFSEAKVLIYSLDHKLLHNTIKEWSVNKGIRFFTWGEGENADIRIEPMNNLPGNLMIKDNRESIEISLPFTDTASIENACHVITLMRYLGYSFKEINSQIQYLTNLPLRLELKDAVNNCQLIYDCYNSDLDSIKIAFDFLRNITETQKKTVILSDLYQTGHDVEAIFVRLLELITKSGVTRLIGVGNDFNRHKNIFVNQPAFEALFFDDTESLIRAIQELNFENEAILLKGARKFEFEKIGKFLEKKVHNTVLEINLNALTNNLIVYRKHLKAGVKLMVMVKAFSYGAGAYEIAKTLQINKVDYLAVAYADEGVKLRQAGITLPIMVMNPDAESLNNIIEYGLEPEIYSIRFFKEFRDIVVKQENGNGEFKIHVKIDSGMNRLGFPLEEIEVLTDHLKLNPDLKVASIFSHLAASDEPGHDSYTKSQISEFEKAYDKLVSFLGYRPLKHILNSAGILRLAEAQFDMVRLGIGIYGIDTTNQIQDELQAVSRLKTRVSQVKKVKSGHSIGYGRMGYAEGDMKIATINIGYADGFSRAFGNGAGAVLIHGIEVPVVGNVCMDMCMIDVTHVDHVNEGDDVIIFGPEYPVQKLAGKLNTIPYEIISVISERVKRVYFEE
jgi:Alr-MurF fusion protein